MENTVKITLYLYLVLVLTGCATHSEFNKTGAGIMAWKSDLSAAFVIPALVQMVIQ